MAQYSFGFITITDPGGDATQAVSDVLLREFNHILFAGGQSDAGVVASVADALECRASGANRVEVGPGYALVRGAYYASTETELLTTVGVTRATRRRVVLEWDLQPGAVNFKQTRLTIVSSPSGSLNTPALVQTPSTRWQIPLCAFTVEPSGNIIDLVDERVQLGPLTPLAIPDPNTCLLYTSPSPRDS